MFIYIQIFNTHSKDVFHKIEFKYKNSLINKKYFKLNTIDTMATIDTKRFDILCEVSKRFREEFPDASIVFEYYS